MNLLSKVNFLTIFVQLILLFLFSCGEVNQLAPYDYEKELGASYSNVHSNVKELDQHYTFNALNNPDDENLRELVEKLIEGVGSTRDKAKVLHDWIAINIFYDLDRYYESDDLYRPYFYLEVLRTRLTMCGGYADLFFVMSKIAGLRVASVTGLAANNHIWNAVYDNGIWNHIDVTWDAGDYRSGKKNPKYSTTYFYLTSAEISAVSNHAELGGGGYDYDESSSPYSNY